MKRIVLNVILPILLVAGAALGAVRLVKTAETTARDPQPATDPLVVVQKVTAYDGPARIHGNGIVEAASQATLSSELNGRVTYMAPSVVEGGRVVQGEALVRIDGRAYKLAVKRERAQVARARVDLELEENASEAARREWAAVGEEPAAGARRVALRKPQVDAASAGIDAAKGALERAQLDLGKTSIRAPFNATVLSESIEVGEIVSPGKVLATLVGTDRFWARLSLPVEDLAFVDFPRGDARGSKVTVTQALSSGKTVVRTGSVLRLVGSLDAQSRTAQVIVEIDRPLDPPPGELPLLIGAFVSAEIEGRLLTGAREVPRKAVFDGNRVWVVDQQGALRRRTLSIALADDERVVATDGVQVEDRVVMTPIRTPTEGMKVRIDESADERQDQDEEASDAGR